MTSAEANTTTTTNPATKDSQAKSDQSHPLHDLGAVLEKYRVEGGIKGMAVSVLYKGELIFAEGFGKRNDEDPFTKDTLMPIGSLTKAFTATAIGELVAEGKMDWDTTPVNTYLPEFEVKDPVVTKQLTLVDLLSHRTNLANVYFRWAKAKESRIELIKYLRYVDQPSKLTSKLNYSNTMYAVAGEAGARVAGVSYEELVKTRVFDPLDLANTGFSQSALKSFSNYALPYDAASFEDAKEGNFIRGELDEDYLSDAPAGDIYSNVLDLARWGRAVLKGGEVDGKQVLNKNSIAETWTGRTFALGTRRSADFAPVVAYGMGWAIDAYKGHAQYSHNGLINGYKSSISLYPDLDLVISVLVNVNKTSLTTTLPFHILDELLDLPRTQDWLFEVSLRNTAMAYTLADKAAKGPLPPKIENQPSVHALKKYAGNYTNLALGDISIVYEESEKKDKEEGEEGALYFRATAFHSKMEHYHYEMFKVVWKIFGSDKAVGVRFLSGSDGEVSRLALVEAPGDEGERFFERKAAAVSVSAVKEE